MQTADPRDVENCYRIFLGRTFESAEVVRQIADNPTDLIVRKFVDSDEFAQEIASPILSGVRLINRFEGVPSVELRHWLVDFVSLSAHGVRNVINAVTWSSLLQCLYTDPAFVEQFGSHGTTVQLLSTLERWPKDLLFGNTAEPAVAAYLPEITPKIIEWKRLVGETGLFDPAYYKAMAPSAAFTEEHVEHYLLIGFKCFFSPGPMFDEILYLATFPSSRDVEIPALVQYALSSKADQLHYVKTLNDCMSGRRKEEWLESGPSMPDSLVNIELRRGERFFRQFGFAFEGTSPWPKVQEAVEILSKLSNEQIVNAASEPLVSVVIPAYGQLPYLLNCLESLSQQVTKFKFEIIVYDDFHPDLELFDYLQSIPWVVCRRGSMNLGFLRAANAAAKLARGKYLVLLNSDVRACGEWLSELVGTFDSSPNAGLVGSKLLNGDGSLQEAGGIIWADGSGWNYGRDDNSNRPKYNYAREVHYCSGASIAIPLELWNEIGGFSEDFVPAYYEDTDLAFRVRQCGREVWYQPLSRAIHYEGRTNGRDLERGIKAFQKTNAVVFRSKWSAVLATHPIKGSSLLDAADGGYKQRLLVLDATMLFPDKDSGSITTFQLIKLFRRLGWSITFAGLHNLSHDAVYSAELNRFGVETVHWPFAHSVNDIIDLRPESYDAVIGLRHNVLYPVFDTIRQRLPLARILYHNMDLHYLRMQRESAISGNRRLRSLAENAHDEESALAARADCTIVTSHREEIVIKEEVPQAPVVVYPYTMEVKESPVGFDTRSSILFVGGYRHTPNVDAAEILITKIWPIIEKELPKGAELVLVGSEMPESIRSRAGGRIKAVGFVPDLDEVLSRARVFSAPLRYGAGVKGKLVTCLANGLPIVCSSIAVEGMQLEDEREVLVADDYVSAAEKILRLYFDKPLWQALQRRGYGFVQSHYSEETGIANCLEALKLADDRWIGRRQLRRALMLDSFSASG
jgi:GT2 family glycosyltransferase